MVQSLAAAVTDPRGSVMRMVRTSAVEIGAAGTA